MAEPVGTQAGKFVGRYGDKATAPDPKDTDTWPAEWWEMAAAGDFSFFDEGAGTGEAEVATEGKITADDLRAYIDEGSEVDQEQLDLENLMAMLEVLNAEEQSVAQAGRTGPLGGSQFDIGGGNEIEASTMGTRMNRALNFDQIMRTRDQAAIDRNPPTPAGNNPITDQIMEMLLQKLGIGGAQAAPVAAAAQASPMRSAAQAMLASRSAGTVPGSAGNPLAGQPAFRNPADIARGGSIPQGGAQIGPADPRLIEMQRILQMMPGR